MKQDFAQEMKRAIQILEHHHQEMGEAISILKKLIPELLAERLDEELFRTLDRMFEVTQVEGYAIQAEATEGRLEIQNFRADFKKQGGKIPPKGDW